MKDLTAEQKVMEDRYAVPHSVKTLRPFTKRKRHQEALWHAAKRQLGFSLQGLEVLDAGCGDGWFSRFMVEEGAKVTGVDYSERGVRHAQSYEPRATFVRGSLLDLPFEDNSFDVIFCFQVIEHLPPADVLKSFQQLSRVLKPSGKCVISVPSINRVLSKAHFQHFTEASFSEMLRPVFDIETIVGVERRTPVLALIEKIAENRWYHSKILSAFVDSIFSRFYMETTPSHGQNLLALLKKR